MPGDAEMNQTVGAIGIEWGEASEQIALNISNKYA